MIKGHESKIKGCESGVKGFIQIYLLTSTFIFLWIDRSEFINILSHVKDIIKINASGGKFLVYYLICV